MWQRTAAPSERGAAADIGRLARIVTLAATALFFLIVCRWRPWDLFDRGGFSADFYDEQARAFVHGHLDVRPEVPGPEGFLIGGRTYLYYGPLLAIARIPFAIVGAIFGSDHWAFGRLTRVSLVLGYAAFLTGAFHLVRAFGDVSARRAALFVAIAAFSPALFLSGWVSVYHETEMWAAVFAVWAAVGTMRLVATPSTRNAVVTGACVVAATMTRAPIGIGLGLGAGVVALMHIRRRHREWWMVLAGCVTAALAHVVVNVAKFRSLTNLPADRQLLTLQNPNRAAWFAGNDGSFFSVRFLKTTLAQYLRPDTLRFERLLPIVRFGPPAPQYGSYPLEATTPTSSLTATATLLLIAAIAGIVVLVRRRQWVPLVLTAGALVAAVPTFAIGFVANRYLVDMLPMLLIPAAAAAAFVHLPRRRVALGIVAALLAWGLWSNAALATWVQNLKEPGFTEWRYEIDDAIFGDPAPALQTLDRTAPVPRNGIVALDISGDECRSVYVAEDGKWNALEHTERFRRLSGALTLDGDTVVVEGDGWELLATTGDNTVQFRVGDLIGEPLAWDGEPLDVSVVADEVEGGFRVTADGRDALFTFAVPPRPMRPGPSFVPTSDRNDHLCSELRARL
jgi:hypothetical protein